ncbi:hypothetical protein MCO_00746, partial [Bartonella sp. DB5-6]
MVAFVKLFLFVDVFFHSQSELSWPVPSCSYY